MRCPEGSIAFLGHRIGWNCRPTKRRYIGIRPDKASVQSICRKISAQTAPKFGSIDEESVVETINRMTSGWANCFCLGQAGPAYWAVDAHAAKRLRQRLYRKHKAESGQYVRFPYERLWNHYGLK